METPPTITSFSNPAIKAVRALRMRKTRKATGLFVAEGARVVIEALELGYPLDRLIVSSSLAAPGAETGPETGPLADLIARFVAAGGLRLIVTPEIMASISGKDNPPQVIAIARQTVTPLTQIDLSRSPLWVVLEGVRDPGNLGTILRTADAVGAGGVILLDRCCDPFSFEAVRASMGAIFALPLAHGTLPEFDSWRREQGAQVIGTALPSSQDYRTVDYAAPLCLMMGNEQSGLPQTHQQACDAVVRIPMWGRADSLNLAVSTGIMLYEIRNRLGG